MDAIRWLIGAKRAPQPVEDDIVYPTGVFDNVAGPHNLVVAWTLCFNDVLDADKLHSALGHLLTIGDWKKFGGRLRQGSNRKLEVHVPRVFTAERPAVAYSHEKLDINIAEHPLASRLPFVKSPSSLPAVYDGAVNFQEFARAPDRPETLADLTSKDVPLLGLRITSFEDATIVGLSFPHALFDGMGQAELLRAWSLVVAGRESDVPPLLGARDDILYDIAAPHTNKAEEEVKSNLEPFRLAGLGFFRFVLWVLCDLVWNQRIDENTVFLPKKFVERLQTEAIQELGTEGAGQTRDGEEGEKKKPWVSEGDVLLAWFAQRMARTTLSSPRPIALATAIDVRTRLPGLSQEGSVNGGVFVNNTILSITMPVSSAAANGPLSAIAFSFRRFLLEQTIEAQALAVLRAQRASWDAGGDGTVLFAHSNAVLFIFTNWTKARNIQAAQFGSAVLRQGGDSETRRNPPGTLAFHHWQVLRAGPLQRNGLGVLGKDHEGNYWLFGYLTPKMWRLVREDLAEWTE